jgi:hypothetical protein
MNSTPLRADFTFLTHQKIASSPAKWVAQASRPAPEYSSNWFGEMIEALSRRRAWSDEPYQYAVPTSRDFEHAIDGQAGAFDDLGDNSMRVRENFWNRVGWGVESDLEGG